MYQYKSLDDTIAAISTAIGQGGIGIVRLSGKECLNIAKACFKPRHKLDLKKCKNFTAHYGWIVDEDDIVDEVLLTVMRAPHSYTKEDVVEISCHGGAVSLKTILSIVTNLGCRLAEPGEFTKRAFLNGRIDLAQAEAVLDIIRSKTDSFLRVSTHQLKGELSTELEIIRGKLMEIYVELEAMINFPEDEVDEQLQKRNTKTLKSKISSTQKRVDKLLETSDHGRILKEGIKIVICGKPNVGKSSLLNIMLKTPRAIVTEMAGTTRDTIEETAQIDGIPFNLVDTAGILEPRDMVEKEAIKRSHMHIESAELVILMLDSSCELSKEDGDLVKALKSRNKIVVVNKCDLKSKIDKDWLSREFPKSKVIEISATKKTGIKKLKTAIVENVWHEKTVDTHGVLLSNARQINSLESCRESISKATENIDDNLSYEFVSEEIKISVNHLDNITGRNIDADLLDTIFSKFCIGK